ncbi:MAG: NAD-dependent epimerase/dehydratase family protein [Salinivirgaceae bacterium]|jgi:dihydroflavonol-4-reductase|nr:NAD-dependent epimerase/dehydratase family protein [Salinivirgaceae bacterium]
MVFVTGGTGFVGSRLIFDLVSKGEEVTALIRPNTALEKFTALIKFYISEPELITKKVNWVKGNIENPADLYANIHEGDKVYHCAAKVSFNVKDSADIIDANVEGTANLVNACLANNVAKLCHVSSIGALGGRINGQQINEETTWSAIGKSAYSFSKYSSELEVWRGMGEGLNAVIVNPAVILGAGDWVTGSPRLFSIVAKGLKLYTKGSTGYVDVRDVTKAMILLMESDICDERFLLSSENMTYKALFSSIAESVNADLPSIYASRFITGLGFRAEKLRSLFVKSEPKLTRQTHKILHTKDIYSGEKIKQELNFSYIPIKECIKFIGNCYLKDNLRC